jgi:hypothetical protein
MIAAGKKLLDSDWNVVQRLLKAIQECCTQFKLGSLFELRFFYFGKIRFKI